VTRGAASVLAATGLISLLTLLSRLGAVSVRSLASSPASFADGRVWLLATSALVADRPEYASIAGFALVGLVAVSLCGARVALVAAVLGHICSAALVYAVVDAVRVGDVSSMPDYGTSAIIAAWIGAIAWAFWVRGRRFEATALPVCAGLLGWLLKGSLTVLDVEHVFALALGLAAARLVVDRAGQVVRPVRLVERHPEPRVDLRHDDLQLRRP
jgi:hypothetical protein